MHLERDSCSSSVRISTSSATATTTATMNLKQYQKISQTKAVCCVVSSMISDILIYTSLLPFFGTFLAGTLAKHNLVSPKTEVILCVAFTFVLLYVAFSIFGEASFWRHLFIFDEFYCKLLQIRDIINSCTIILCLICLGSAVQLMVKDKEMKPQYLGEGAGYVFLMTICTGFNIDLGLLSKFGMKLPHTGTVLDPDFGENERFIHGATYVLYWAVLTACIAKLLYFNTLFTYVRAMRLFVSLRPLFGKEKIRI